MTETGICVVVHVRDPERPRRAIDGGYLCVGCVERLRSLVAALPVRYAELGRALPAVGGAGDKVTGTPESALLFNELVSAHRALIVERLASWCRLVARERGATPPASVSVGVLSGWLLMHVDWLAHHKEWAGDVKKAMEELTSRAWSLLDPNPDRRRFEIPGEACLVPECTGRLFVVQRPEPDAEDPADRSRWMTLVECDGEDNHVWGSEQFKALGHRLALRRQRAVKEAS